MEKSRIERMEGESVVLRLSRAVDARVLALLTKLLEAVDSEADDLYILKPTIDPTQPNTVPAPPFPWPNTIPCPAPYPPGTVVCYGCGPVIYYTDGGFDGYKSVCTSEHTVSFTASSGDKQ